MKKRLYLISIILLMMGCQENHTPKPKGYLALEYPPHRYQMLQTNCPYSFLINKRAKVKPSVRHRPCMINIVYPEMRGTIYISYEPVHDGNLRKLLKDAQKLPLKHTIMANQIIGDQYTNELHHTYGMLYRITGNAASQAQFYLTDSTEHFITGSIYFRQEPNYDSIYPAAAYLIQDMKKLMESLRWQ